MMDVAMLHGWASSRASWQPLLSHLPECTPHFIDLPGHSGAPDQITIEQQLSTIKSPYFLCAWSLGSLLALEYALTQPSTLRGLILFSPIACFIAHENWPHAMPQPVFEQFERRFFKKQTPDIRYFRLLAASGSKQSKREATRLAQLDHRFPEPSLSGLKTGLAQLTNKDISRQIAQINMPVLLISGRQDALVPIESVIDLSKQLTEVTYKVLDDVGHLPHIVSPKRCADLISHWIQHVVV
jgi:pimeloyl-[acyl-carrier protein] methyl ester esterase